MRPGSVAPLPPHFPMEILHWESKARPGRCLLAPHPGSENILLFCQHTEKDFSWRLPHPFPAGGASRMDHKGCRAVGMAVPSTGKAGTGPELDPWNSSSGLPE